MNDSSPSATPVLLLPGLICDARIWGPQVEALRTQRDVRAINNYGTADTLGAMAEKALERAPARFAVIGHSMGGRVALEVFRRAPERVVGFGILSTGTHLPKPNEADGRFALFNRGVEEGMDALIGAWLPPMVWEPNRSIAGLMDMLWEMCSDSGLDMFERQIRALLARPEVDSLLPQIRCPALVVTGEHDAWAPPAQHEPIAAAIDDVTYAIIPNAGHMVPVEQPDAVTRTIIQWLTKVDAFAAAKQA